MKRDTNTVPWFLFSFVIATASMAMLWVLLVLQLVLRR